MRISATMLTTALAVGVAGCRGGADAGPATLVRDSTGIEIVESLRPLWAPDERWSVAPEPTLEIGLAEGPDEYLLDVVGEALRLTNGRIAVSNRRTREIRFFSPEGEYLGSAGRQGDGPGEFNGLMGIWKGRGDSLLALDGRNFRVSVFDDQGALGRIVTFPTSSPLGLPSPFGLASSGAFFVTSGSGGGIRYGQEGLITGGTIYLSRFSPDGELLNEIVGLPASPHWGYLAGGRFTANYPPFSVGWMVYGWDPERLYAGTGDLPEIQVRKPDGALERILRWSAEPRPVTDVVRSQYREYLLGAFEDQDQRRYWDGWLAEVPFPEQLPAYQTLLTDTEGNL